MGISVIPNWPKTKHPAFGEGEYKKYYDEPCFVDPKPGQNIGGMLGRPSNNLVCFDDDTREDWFLEIFPEYLTKTFCTKSGGGGSGIFFRLMELPKFRQAKIIKNGKTIEFFSRNRQIILPPSTHPETGKQYEILNDSEILNISREEFSKIFSEFEKLGFEIKYTKDYESYEPSFEDSISTKQLLSEDWAEGDRHDNGLKLALRRFHSGWNYDKTLNDSLKKNSSLSHPTSVDYVERWVNQAQELHKRNVKDPNSPYFKSAETQDTQTTIVLKKLSEIDRPEYANKAVKVNAVIASNSISYNVPTKINAVCNNDSDKHNCISQKEIKIHPDNFVKFVEIPDYKRYQLLEDFGNAVFTSDCNLSIDEIESTTIRRLRIRPIVSSLYKQASTFLDDSGNEWSAYDVYVLQDEIQNLEAGKEIEVIGRVIADPKTGKITMLVNKIKYLDENKFDIGNLKSLQSFCKDKTPKEIMDFLTMEFEKYSRIVKRRNVTETGLLTFFSPLYLDFDGKRITSWIKSVIIGDSTTGKSETIRQLIILLKAGQIISGEMASVAGLAGASVQATGGQWFLDFGVLPMQDRKFLAVDGAHKLKKEELDRLAEAERNGKIEINKAAKGDAYARTRQIKIFNPVDEDGLTTIPMDSFLYPVQALKHTLQIQSIARIDLCCFVSDDIKVNERNIKNNNDYDHKLDYLSDLVMFIWSNDYELVFDDDVIQLILDKATILENKFKFDEYPLITNDQKYKIAKLCASLACVTCSFNDDLTKITVTKEHVEYITKMIETEYSNASLDTLVNQSKFNEIDLEYIYTLTKNIEDKINRTKEESLNIIEWVTKQQKINRDDIQEEFSLSRDKQAQPLLTYLKNEKIIKMARNHYSVAKKGVSIARFIVNFSSCSSSSSTKKDIPLKNKNHFGGVSLLVELEALQALKIRTFQCNDCNTVWENTEDSLEDITQNHAKNHVIVEAYAS